MRFTVKDMLNLFSYLVAKVVNFLLGLDFLHLSAINDLTRLNVGISMILGAFILAPIYKYSKALISNYFEIDSVKLGWKARIISFIALVLCFSRSFLISTLAIVVFLFVIPVLSYKLQSMDFVFRDKFTSLKSFLEKANESRHNLSNKVVQKNTAHNQPKKSAAKKYRRRY